MFLISKAIAAAVDISIPCISCNNASGENPVGLIADFYELALALSGVLALGMIIYAGILRITSANKPGSVSESNDIIFNALLGIVLLFGAYILLNTINPELTKLEIPKLSEIELKKQEAANPNDGYCTKEHPGTCSMVGQRCEQQEDKTYKCVAVDEMIWACYDKASFLRACYRVGSAVSPEGRAQKASCDAYCINGGYNKDGCVSSIKPKAGCKIFTDD